MTGAELNTLINFKAGTNDTTFTPAAKLPIVNIFIKEISTKIVSRNAGYFLVPTVFDLVASATMREYKFPDDMLNTIQKVEFKFTSTSSRFPSTYIKDYRGSETESEIVKQFTNEQGGFAHTIRRRAIFLLSGTVVAVTGGGRLWYHAYPAALANLSGSTDLALDPSTTTFGFPQPFQELLARRVSIEYKSSRPKPIPLSRHELNYENDLKDALDDIAHVDNSGEIIGDSLSDQDTGNNGFNY